MIKIVSLIIFLFLISQCTSKKEIPNLKEPLLGEYICNIDKTVEKISFLNDTEYLQVYIKGDKQIINNKGKYDLDYINDRQGYSLNFKNYIVTNPAIIFEKSKFGDTLNTVFFYNVYSDSSAVIRRFVELNKYDLNLHR